MNDFEIQRRLRETRTPRAPQVDLWPAIEKRLATGEPPVALAPRRRRGWPQAAAAAVLLAVLGGGLAHLAQPSFAPGLARLDADAFARVSPTDPDLARHAPGGDPRLADAAIVLDAAQFELRQAIAQKPDARFLVNLLHRTSARRSELDRHGAETG